MRERRRGKGIRAPDSADIPARRLVAAHCECLHVESADQRDYKD